MIKFKKKSFTRSSFTIPVIIIATFAVILGTLLGIMRHNNILKQEQSNELLADRYSKIIESNLKGNINFLNLLANELIEDDLPESAFQDKVNDYLKNHPEFINITWVDSTFKIKSVCPLKENSHIIGLSIELPMPKKASRLAKKQKQTIYTEPFEAIQGKSSFEAWDPVFIKNKFMGLFAAVYSSNDILNTWIDINKYPNTYFNLLDSNNEVVTELSNSKSGTEVVSTKKSMSSLNNGMKLQVESKINSLFSPLIIFIILLLSILIFVITYSLWKLKNAQILLHKKERLLVDQNTDLKLAKEKVEESEEKYKALYENAPLSYQSLNKDGYIIDVNPTWLKTLGYTRDEVLGKWFGDFLHPDFVEHFRINFPEFKKRGFINDVQFRIRDKKGNYLYISFEGCIGYDPDGIVKQTYCTFKDVTSEVLAKKELIIAKEKAEENEEKFSGIYEQSPIAIEIYDIDGKLIDVNQQALKMFGVDDKKHIPEFILWENSHYPDEKLENLKNGKPFFISNDFDFEVVKLNKLFPTNRSGKIYVDVYAVPLMEKEKVTGYLVQIMDITDRKQVEKALLVNQKRYIKAQAIGHVGNWEYDPVTTNFWASDEARRIYGYDIEQKNFTTEHVESCIPERARVHKALIDLLEHDKKYDIVYDIITGDKGIRKTVYSIAEIERDALGNPSKISGVISDITKQKKAEEKLKDSEYLYKESQRLGKMGGWSYDVESGESTFTDTLYEIYGKIFLTAEEGIQFYHPDDKEMVFNLFNEALTKQKPYDVEVRFINAQGNTLFVRTIGRPVIKNGKVVKLYGNLIDITERKLAEDKIRITEKNLKNTFDISPSIISIAKIDTGYFIEVNKTVTQILGYSVEEFTSKPILEFIHPDDRQRTIDQISEQQKGNKTTFFENRYLCKNASYKWMAWNATKADENGIVIAIGSDIHERRQAEEEVKKYQEHLEEIVEERTKKLEEKNKELERFNDLFVDREFRIKELKEIIKKLKNE